MKKTLLFLMALIMSAGFTFAVTPIVDFSGLDDASNQDSQQGWLVSGIMDELASAKYLVIETEGVGDNAGGFGGLHFIFQGNDGDPATVTVDWTDTGLDGNWESYPREDGKTVSIVVDLKSALGTHYDDFLQCTNWARILLGYYGGATAFEGLGLTNVYLIGACDKPDDAVDLTGGTNLGFIFDGTIDDLTFTPIVLPASSKVSGVYIASKAVDQYTGATINLGNDTSVWPWSNGDNGDENVAFTPEKDATYHMEFNVTSVDDTNPASGFRVRWLKDDAYDNHTAADAAAVNANVYAADETAVLIPALFSSTIATDETKTYKVDFTMDGNELADGLVGNLGIRGHYGATGFVINTIVITDADGNQLVNYDKNAPGDETAIIKVKPNVSSNAYGVDGGIIVNANNEKVSVFSIDGRLVKQAVVTGNNTMLSVSRGIYIVKVGAANPVKVLVK